MKVVIAIDLFIRVVVIATKVRNLVFIIINGHFYSANFTRQRSGTVLNLAGYGASHLLEVFIVQFELGTSPKKSVPGRAERQTVSAAEKVTLPRALSEDEVKKIDEECHQRFVKMDAKYVEPGDVSLCEDHSYVTRFLSV